MHRLTTDCSSVSRDRVDDEPGPGGAVEGGDQPGRAWSAVIFASRDTPREVQLTLQAAVRAACRPTVIDVICNGNRPLANELRAPLQACAEQSPQHAFRVWYLPIADKANAWNHYLLSIWAGSETGFFLDGYCRVNEAGMDSLSAGLDAAPDALATTSLPSVGRSADRWRAGILAEGGLAGGFFALRGSAIEEMRRRRVRLPLGLYGYDGLVGAMLAFGLDPSTHEWDLKRRVQPQDGATWETTERHWWRPGDLKGHWDRRIRAALRTMVGLATRDFMATRKQLPEYLPRTTRDFVLNWVAANRLDFLRLLVTNPACLLAWRRLRVPQDWSLADVGPELVASFGTVDAEATSWPAGTPGISGAAS